MGYVNPGDATWCFSNNPVNRVALGQDFYGGYVEPNTFNLCIQFANPSKLFVSPDNFWEFACETL